jgi:predicted DNA-binding transcriptional regulator YafY
MATRPSRLERITNLVLVLVSTLRPLPLREIGATVAGYPAEYGALRQAFERDKKTLRDGGIPVSAEQIGGEDQYGYRIIPEQYYLPELGLTSAEEAELAFAVAAVRLEGGFGDDALAKLGLSEPLGQRPLALLPALPALGALHEAIGRRCVVGFAYRGREREVEPYGLLFRSGAWYLVGLDRGAALGGARRTFRVDRLESPPSLGAAGSFEAPRIDIGAELRRAPIALAPPALAPPAVEAGTGPAGADDDAAGEDDLVTVAVLDVDAREAPVVLAALGASSLQARRRDGSLRLACRIADENGFARWVLGFGEAVEVVAPPQLRAAVVALLEQAAAADSAPAELRPVPGTAAAGAEGAGGAAPASGVGRASGVAAASGASSNLDAGARLHRLLAVLAYLARVGGAPIAELAERFGMAPQALVADLELAACCGLPPYTPDQLLELIVDEVRVDALHLSALKRPPRLTPEEGFAVAAACRALLAVQGADLDGPLGGALAKLEQALGSARLEVEIDRPDLLAPLQAAAAAGETLEIRYLGRAGLERERLVEPYAVVVREGRWYLDAFCRLAGDWRRFQVERVRSARLTGLSVQARTPPAAFAGVRAFVGGPGTHRALVDLPDAGRALLDRVACGPPEPGQPGRVVVPVDVADETWFGRLLLGIPDAVVLEPAELAGSAAKVAQRGLERYRTTRAGAPRRRGARVAPTPAP